MPIRNKISSSKYLIKLIFALNIPKNIDVDFDMTTLLLRYCITREIKENKKIFEMGIGTGALLSNFIAKRYKSQVYGADISERRVEQSKIVSKSNDIKSFFLCSNLF